MPTAIQTSMRYLVALNVKAERNRGLRIKEDLYHLKNIFKCSPFSYAKPDPWTRQKLTRLKVGHCAGKLIFLQEI